LLSTIAAIALTNATTTLGGQFDQLLSKIGGAFVERLREDAFYKHFLARVQTADNTVRIAYFAPNRPQSVPDLERDRYYDAIARAMAENGRITFKRLLRATPSNEEWAAELVGRFENHSNIHIALLRGDRPDNQTMPLALSVQVVDADKSWLVAVASHEREGEFRDLYIESREIAERMTTYYERLWKMGDVLLEAGRITQSGRAFLERQARS
jgi:hypothetical protein